MGIDKSLTLQLPEIGTIQDVDRFHTNSGGVDYKTRALSMKRYLFRNTGGQLIRYGSNMPVPYGSFSSSSGIPLDNTKPLSSEGIEIMSRSYTKALPETKMRVEFVVNISSGIYSNQHFTVALFVNNDTEAAVASTDYFISPDQMMIIHGMTIIYSITASPVVFKLRASDTTPGGTSMALNGRSTGEIFDGVLSSGIEIWELP